MFFFFYGSLLLTLKAQGDARPASGLPFPAVHVKRDQNNSAQETSRILWVSIRCGLFSLLDTIADVPSADTMFYLLYLGYDIPCPRQFCTSS